ncbi:hypothetical protein LWI29_011052 [Acer saccharum]|uniref:Gamma-soluble NSF attachment protein n=1 Tax=Acer saccharum TaxID=4024 RepID=A0AA39RTS9_ACESA|nr:hypothetical protein LWI29_011052 [Acer saccharum]
MQIARFQGGLKLEIQDQMKILNTFTLGQTFDLARKAEEPTRAPPDRTRFANQQFQVGPSRITTLNEPAVEASGAESRPKRVAPQPTPNPYARPMPSLCYRCHQPGHRSNQCPQRPAINFVEGDYAEDEEEIDHKNSSWDRGSLEVKGNARTTGNTGTHEEKLSCIVQRIFLTPKRGPDTSTRHQVFRTNALINGVIAKTVIDIGSSENLVSKELVKRLKLPTEKHPQPYGLRWIRKVEGATETVNENLVEEKDKKVKELEENIAAVAFTANSKMGKALMSKCKTLQEENDEIGRQNEEGELDRELETWRLGVCYSAAMAGSNPDKLMTKADKLTQLSLTRWSADWKVPPYCMSKLAMLLGFPKNMIRLKLHLKKLPKDKRCFLHLGMLLNTWRSQPASDALAKAARALEEVAPEDAVQLYIDACVILEEDGKEQMAFDLYRPATTVYIKLEKYADAATLLLRWGLAADSCKATNSQCKAYLSAIIVYLYAHDIKQAEKCYNDCSQIDAFLRSDQNRCASKLLSAYMEGDIEEIKRLAQSSTISNLDHMIIRIARKLPTGDVSGLKMDATKDEECSMKMISRSFF